MKLRIKKGNIANIMLTYCLFYICTFFLFDTFVGIVFKLVFYGCIAYGILGYVIIILIHNRRILYGISPVTIITFILLIVAFGILCLNVQDSDQRIRGLYQYVFYLMIFLATGYYVSKCNLNAAFDFLRQFGVVLSICSLYEQITRHYIIGMATKSYWTTYSTVNNDNSGAIRAVVFSGSFLAFGILMAVISIVAFYFYLKDKKLKNLIVLVFDVIGLLMSMSRGPWLATAVAFSLMYINAGASLQWRLRTKNVFKIIGIYIALIMAMAILSNYISAINSVWTRVVSIFAWSGNDLGNLGRISRWVSAIDIFKRNWAFGIGPASTGSRYTIITESGVLKRLIECGFFVTLLYYIFIIDIVKQGFRNAWRTKNPYIMVALGVIICILFEDIYLQITEEINVYFLMCFAISALYYRSKPNAETAIDGKTQGNGEK